MCSRLYCIDETGCWKTKSKNHACFTEADFWFCSGNYFFWKADPQKICRNVLARLIFKKLCACSQSLSRAWVGFLSFLLSSRKIMSRRTSNRLFLNRISWQCCNKIKSQTLHFAFFWSFFWRWRNLFFAKNREKLQLHRVAKKLQIGLFENQDGRETFFLHLVCQVKCNVFKEDCVTKSIKFLKLRHRLFYGPQRPDLLQQRLYGALKFSLIEKASINKQKSKHSWIHRHKSICWQASVIVMPVKAAVMPIAVNFSMFDKQASSSLVPAKSFLHSMIAKSCNSYNSFRKTSKNHLQYQNVGKSEDCFPEGKYGVDLSSTLTWANIVCIKKADIICAETPEPSQQTESFQHLQR